MVKIIGIIVVLVLALLFVVLTCRSKGSDHYKWIGIALFVAFCFSWIIPYGLFQDGTIYDLGLLRLGLSDIPNVIYTGIYFSMYNILYLLALGGFYGVISKTDGYSTLVKKLANVIKGKEIVSTIIIILVLACLTSLIGNTFVILFFVPFLVSVLLNAKFDKVTTMGITFGSVLVGVLGATFGTDSLYWFNAYTGSEITVGLKYRLVLAAVAIILFIALNVYRVIKMKTKSRINDVKEDLYVLEDTKNAKGKIWPTVIILALIAIFIIVGYVNWAETFKIEFFNDFHTKLTGLKLGSIKIFSVILGSKATALGSLQISSMITILLLTTVLVAFMNRMKFKDMFESFGQGIVKILKPVSLYILVNILFMVAMDGNNSSTFMATISDWAFGLTKTFNPYITTVTAFVTSIFNSDFGYTGFLVGSVLTTTFKDSLALAHTIYVATYGLVQVCVPTSGLLLIGLSYLKVDYKQWFKYIWMFVVAFILVLLIFVTVAHFWL